MNETDEQRDTRLRRILDEVVADLAMWHLADAIYEDGDPVGQAAYDRLECLGSFDLARIVVLLIGDTHRPRVLAAQMLTGFRSAEVPVTQVAEWAQDGAM